MTLVQGELPDRRFLDPSESFHAAADWCGAHAVICTGDLDAPTLELAFETLSTQAPILCSQLERSDRGFLLRAAVERRPRMVITDGEEDDILREMRCPMDSSDTTSRLIVVRGSVTTGVILILHHAIADATGGLLLFTEFWRLYTAAISGLPPLVRAPAALTPSAEQALLHHVGQDVRDGLSEWQERAAWVRRRLSALATELHLPPSSVERIRLSRTVTARLVARARLEGLTLHGLVCGVVLATVRDEVLCDRPEDHIVCGCPVDMRQWVHPPLKGDDVTNCVVGLEIDVSVPRKADPVAVGRAFSSRLDLILAGINPEQRLLDSVAYAGGGVQVDCVISNVGQLPAMPTPPGVSIVDYRGFTSTAFPDMMLFIVSIFDGRLSLDVVTSEGWLSEQRSSQFTERLLSALECVTGV